jgi:hypothetical protein
MEHVHDFSQEQMLLWGTHFSHLSRDQFLYLLCFCQECGWTPWIEKLTAEKQHFGEFHSVIVLGTIDVLRERVWPMREYLGQVTEWCGTDRKWTEHWDPKARPVAARVGIRVKGVGGLCSWTVHWREFVQWHLDQRGKPVMDPLWKDRPAEAIARVAESNSLHRAFPCICGSLHIREELHMPKIDEPADSEAPESEDQFYQQLFDRYRLRDNKERQMAIARMKEKFPQLEGRAFYLAALRGIRAEQCFDVM